MWHELSAGGVYMPPLLAYLLAALVLYLPLRVVLGWLGLWRWAWNQPLAELGVYTIVLGALSVLL